MTDVLMTPVPYATTIPQDDVVILVKDTNADSGSEKCSNMVNDGGAYLPRIMGFICSEGMGQITTQKNAL